MQEQSKNTRDTQKKDAAQIWEESKRKLKNYLATYMPQNARELLQSKGLRNIRQILCGIGTGLYAWAVSCAQFPFGTAPLGLALLCAASGYVPYIYIGVLLSALSRTGEAMTVLLEATTLLLCRAAAGMFLSPKEGKIRLFHEGLLFRLGEGVAVCFVFGLLRVVKSGFLYYDIFGALLMIFGVPLAAWLFYGVSRTANRNSLYYETAVNALLAAGVYALRGFSIASVTPAVPAAFLITLYVSRAGGMLRGCFSGLLCGMACSVSMGPVMALSGIASGLLWNISRSAAVTAAALCAVTFGAYTQGWRALQVLAPEILISAMVFLPLAQFGLLPRVRLFERGGAGASAGEGALLSERKAQKTATQLQALSGALESLSDVFYNLSDRLRRPGIFQVRRQCTAEVESHCSTCSMHYKCWEQNYSRTIEAVDVLARALQKNDKLSMEDLPDWMRTNCPRAGLMVAALNLSAADLREELRSRDKTGVVAMDYESMAKLVEDASGDDPDSVYDGVCSDKVLHAADYMDLRIDTAAVYGTRRRTLICGGVDLGAFRMSAASLTENMSRLCETQFGPPSFEIENGEGYSDGYVTMTMQSCRRFGAETACASKAEPTQSVSGDHLITFENGDDYFYTLLSDGMGTGREAALTSRVCGVFMEKMLRASARKDIALEMLNGVIRTKGMECFATVDLLEIDLITGHAGFIKGGAAPSYILRNGNLFKIASNTMPIGITREMNAEEITFELQAGDVIVMASDGVAQSFEDGIWLVNLLGNGMEDDLDVMANKILEAARRNNRRTDDMTVGLIRLTEQAA